MDHGHVEKDGRYILPLKAMVRKAEGLEEGDEIFRAAGCWVNWPNHWYPANQQVSLEFCATMQRGRR
ncbi:MAG: DUF1905 domain-containing protein [Chloroflexota bacterium]